MCGILGYSRSKNSQVSTETMKVILSILINRMDDRGGDSWGWYSDGRIKKGVGTASFGVDLNDIAGNQMLMLHTRKATVGAKTAANAHPWRINNLIGMHNGGVANHDEMNRKYKRDFDVDSMHIFAHISEDRPLSELIAHGAIVYTDELAPVPGTIWHSRFNGGVLTVAKICSARGKPSTDVIFCSLADPIRSALDLAKVPFYQGFKTEENRLYHIESGQLFFKLPEIELPFAEKSGYSNRYNFDLNCGYDDDWGLRTGCGMGFRPEMLPPKPQERSGSVGSSTALSIKAFVRVRQGLEAWYKEGICSWCNANRAQLRIPCTEQFYCMACWTRIEGFVPFLLDATEHDLFLDDQSAKQVTATMSSEVADAEDEEIITICEECQQEPPRWYCTKLDMVICEICRQERGLGIENLVDVRVPPASILKPGILNATDQRLVMIEKHVGEFDPAKEGRCECSPNCQEPGRFHYMSELQKKLLWVSNKCFDRLYGADGKLRTSKILSFKHAVDEKISARKPDFDGVPFEVH